MNKFDLENAQEKVTKKTVYGEKCLCHSKVIGNHTWEIKIFKETTGEYVDTILRGYKFYKDCLENVPSGRISRKKALEF